MRVCRLNQMHSAYRNAQWHSVARTVRVNLEAGIYSRTKLTLDKGRGGETNKQTDKKKNQEKMYWQCNQQETLIAPIPRPPLSFRMIWSGTTRPQTAALPRAHAQASQCRHCLEASLKETLFVSSVAGSGGHHHGTHRFCVQYFTQKGLFSFHTHLYAFTHSFTFSWIFLLLLCLCCCFFFSKDEL